MNISDYLEHTVLKATTSSADVQKLCDEAIEYSFKGVCVPPYYVKEVKNRLKGTGILPVTVVAFPMGYSTTSAKVDEIKRAINDGAEELDVVVNVAAIKSGNWDHVKNDVETVTTMAHMKGKKVKLISEVGYLTDEELKEVCNIVTMFSVDFFKTSSGYTGVDTTAEMVAKIRKMLPEDIAIKASGGIRDLDTALAIIKAGATRIGSSSCVKIAEEEKGNCLDTHKFLS